MIEEVEIDIGQLSSDLDQLCQLRVKLKQNMGLMEESIKELNNTWEGAAHDEFIRGFDEDCKSINEMMTTLSQFLESLEYARNEYSKCDADIKSSVDAIRI